MKVFLELPGYRHVVITVFASILCCNSWSQVPSKYEPAPEFRKIVNKDWTTYLGQVENGLASGIGTLTDLNGDKKTGYFQDGNFLGEYIVNPCWHLVDIYYEFEDSILMESFSIDITIQDDIPEDMYLYLCTQSSDINQMGFYNGIQTHCGGYRGVNGENNFGNFVDLGRASIFSRWSQRLGTAMKIQKSGVGESGGYEGDFISVRNTLPWKKGKYTITLRNTHEKVTIDDVVHTFVAMQVFSHEKKSLIQTGSLAFPGEQLFLDKNQAIFVELYYKRLPVSKIPYLHFQFDQIKVNGELETPLLPIAVYPFNAPQYAKATFSEGKFDVQIGKPFERNSFRFYKNEVIIEDLE